MFNKGEYVGHLEPPIDEIPQTLVNLNSSTTHSITTERMKAEKVKPDTFKPPCHKLKQISKQNSWNCERNTTPSLPKMKPPLEPHL